MMFTEEILIRVGIVLLSFTGFLVARHIYKEKRSERPLVCPVKFNCDTVVHSDYSKFLGIPLEIFGMIYYALVFLSYVVFLIAPHFFSNAFVGFMALASMAAFLFSMYLIGVQVFILKEFCSWCIVSAALCVLIFTLTVLAYDFTELALVFVR